MIDYDEIARIAEKSRMCYASLCERAERGLPLPPIPDDDWLTLAQAATVLSCHYESMTVYLRESLVRQRSRSLTKLRARRGCGVLVHREDIEKIKDIRTRCRLGLAATFRVFDMLREDALI